MDNNKILWFLITILKVGASAIAASKILFFNAMAAALISVKAGGKSRAIIVEDGKGDKVLKLPEEKERVFDVEMGMLMLNGCVSHLTLLKLVSLDVLISGAGKCEEWFGTNKLFFSREPERSSFLIQYLLPRSHQYNKSTSLNTMGWHRPPLSPCQM